MIRPNQNYLYSYSKYNCLTDFIYIYNVFNNHNTIIFYNYKTCIFFPLKCALIQSYLCVSLITAVVSFNASKSSCARVLFTSSPNTDRISCRTFSCRSGLSDSCRRIQVSATLVVYKVPY